MNIETVAVHTQHALEQVSTVFTCSTFYLSTLSSIFTCSWSRSEKETRIVEGLWFEKDSYGQRCQTFAPGADMFNF